MISVLFTYQPDRYYGSCLSVTSITSDGTKPVIEEHDMYVLYSKTLQLVFVSQAIDMANARIFFGG